MSSLVSIIIVTYNSSQFILETLNSAKSQTYKNIELIITDDASTDDTVNICNDWLMNNASRFVRTVVLTSFHNTGVTGNTNRGLYAAKGEWIKFIAGDDALLPNCIEDNLNHIAANPEIKILFSICRMYSVNFNEEYFIRLNPSQYPSNIITKDITPQEQYKLLLISNRIPYTPSAFHHRETLKRYSNLDERYSFSEDYQMWLNLTKNGIKLHFMERETVKYRSHDMSLSKQSEVYIVHPMYFRNEPTMKKLSYPYLPWDIKCSKIHIWYMNQIFKIKFFNKRTKLNVLLHYFLTRIMNPYNYSVYIKSHFIKSYKNDIFYQ